MSSFKERIHATEAGILEEEMRGEQEVERRRDALITPCLQPLIHVVKASPIEGVLGEMKKERMVLDFKFWLVAAINCDVYPGKQRWPQFISLFTAAREEYLTACVDSVDQLEPGYFRVSEYLTSSREERKFLPNLEDKYVLSNPKVGYVATWQTGGWGYDSAASLIFKGNGIIVRGEKDTTLSPRNLEGREALEEAVLNAYRRPYLDHRVIHSPAHNIRWPDQHRAGARFSSL